jgi:serine/threonine protein kinase
MRDLIRRVVDSYKSLKLVGEDQGFVFFQGQDPDTKQPVAIKILPQLLGKDPQISAGFRSLSQTIRQLNHPNIASVRKVGEESGLPYVVTRAIEKGQPLAQKLDQPWAVDAAADLVMQVGHALEHAYKKGIVHGSLSPENVAVQENGKVMVTDFGLTELQNLLGLQLKETTSPFLAPEQSAGQPADARADVYALAALVYRMLAKRNPQVLRSQVVPPSQFNADIPPALDNVVVKALSANPADRYPDVKSFIAAFGAVSLAPRVQGRQPQRAELHCPQCGAEHQTGRFCRKCGGRLRGSGLNEPIQITTIDVGHVELGKGVKAHETIIAQPMPVATGELLDQFPTPPEVPRVDLSSIWPARDGQALMAMPEPPPMPVIDWAEIAPPMPKVPSIGDMGPPSEEDESGST